VSLLQRIKRIFGRTGVLMTLAFFAVTFLLIASHFIGWYRKEGVKFYKTIYQPLQIGWKEEPGRKRSDAIKERQQAIWLWPIAKYQINKTLAWYKQADREVIQMAQDRKYRKKDRK